MSKLDFLKMNELSWPTCDLRPLEGLSLKGKKCERRLVGRKTVRMSMCEKAEEQSLWICAGIWGEWRLVNGNQK